MDEERKSELIATGYSGRAFAITKPGKPTYVIKELYVNTDRQLEESKKLFDQEVGILKKLGTHPNIVKLLGSKKSHLTLKLEYAPEGDLFGFMDKVDTKSPAWLSQQLVLINQLLFALKYLNTQRVVHRDIKPENILVFPRNRLKLCDFALSIGLPEGQDTHLSIVLGTGNYLAPELVQPGSEARELVPYSCASDLWALGLVIWFLYWNRHPFRSIIEGRPASTYLPKLHQHFQERSNAGQAPVPIPRCPLPVKSMLLDIFNVDPKKRPSIELLNPIEVEAIEANQAGPSSLTS